MPSLTYQHACPYAPTLGDLQGILLAAWELAQAAAQVATSPALAAQLQDVIPVLRRHITDLSKRDQLATPKATGLLMADYCEPVKMAWNLSAQVALAAPGQLDEALAAFGQANALVRLPTVAPSTPGPGVSPALQIVGSLVLGGAVIGLFTWLASRAPRPALGPRREHQVGGLRGPKRPTPLTDTNLSALWDLFGDRTAPKGTPTRARMRVPNRVAPVDAPHIRRAIQRGVVTVEKHELVLDPQVAALLWSTVPVYRGDQTAEYKAAQAVLDDYLAHKVA